MAVPDINNIAISDASVRIMLSPYTVIGGTISFVQWFSLPPQSENKASLTLLSARFFTHGGAPTYGSTPLTCGNDDVYQACLSREEVTDTPSAQAGEYY